MYKKPNDYKKIFKACVNYAKRMGYESEAEDFAQCVCMHMFEKGSGALYLKKRFIDYLRVNFGNSKRETGRLKSMAHKYFNDLNPSYEIGCLDDSPDHRMDVIRLISSAGLSERQILILIWHHIYGVEMREIGEFLGVTESRVCQISAKSIRTIRAYLKEKDGPNTDK